MAKKKSSEIAILPTQEVGIESLLQRAVDKGVPVETLERLLAMRTQLKAERAKEAYDRAMAAFQAECPTIVKTKEVRTKSGQVAYRFAPIESIVAQVKDLIQKNQFSYSFTMELRDTGVKVICKITHAEGHSSESIMDIPFGSKTEIMSNSQVAAAATTFGKRYAFLNGFGIMTGDEDTDSRAEGARPVRETRMKSYQVARVVPIEDDEAQGTMPEPRSVVKGQKLDIANLLKEKRNYTMLGKSAEEVSAIIMNITGMALIEDNYAAIIEELQSL